MEITAQVQKELELFNRGRTRDNGAYLISIARIMRCGANFFLLRPISLSVRWA